MTPIDIKLREVRQKDPRYARNAYLFAFQSLDYTLRDKMGLTDEVMAEMEENERHLSAEQLLLGMRDCAVEQFGFLAKDVWESWGIRTTEDWGNVVFNLIEASLMRASDDDKREDFQGVFDLQQAFDEAWSWN